MQTFEDIGDSLGVAQCLRSLGNILQMTNQYSEATVKLEKAMQTFEDIGNTLGAAQCLQILGDILRMTDQYLEATVKLEKAMQTFEDIGDSLGAAQCCEAWKYFANDRSISRGNLSSWRRLCRNLKTLETLLEQHNVCKAWGILCE